MVRSRKKACLPWPVFVFGGSAWAVWLARTRPFTWPADVATAIPIVMIAAFAISSVVGTVQSTDQPAGDGGPARGRGPVPSEAPGSTGRWGLVWPIAAMVVASFELVNFVQGPRSSHPTLSWMLDSLDSVWWIKGVTFLGWLALGVYLARR
ncbi:MAG: hypothetical protein ACYCVN_10520 [Acidimicrobiales bacterium]